MSSNTMSVATFALSAPLEDGAYFKEENIFKIEVGLLGRPSPSASPAFPATSRLSLGAWRGLFSSSVEPRKGQVGNLPNGAGRWDQLLSWSP